ncbi:MULTISPECIES: prepilin peptidase [unclassified Microbacterium]|uniref:prepilin peptidase n=1 Tax=unclassified Microbacterium TaxID=2609290 RepID=UPI000C2CE2C8|nr:MULTISPECIES: prepilin peptidase [unclassified Microbacterium]
MTRPAPPAVAPAAPHRLIPAATTGLAIAVGAVATGIDRALPPAGTAALLGAGAIVLVAVSVVDLRTHQIPDRLLLPLTGLAVGWLAAGALLTGDLARTHLGGAALAAVVLAAVYFVLGLLGAVGFGDVKLAGALGLWVGGLGGVAWMLIPVVAVGISGMHQLVVYVLHRPGAVAHGPALAVAAAVCTVAALSA